VLFVVAVTTVTVASCTTLAGLHLVSTVQRVSTRSWGRSNATVNTVSTDPGANTSTVVLLPRARTALRAPTLQLPEVTSARAPADMSVRRAMILIHAAMVVREPSVSSMAVRVLRFPALDVWSCTPAHVRQDSTEQTVPDTIRVLRRRV